DGQGRPLTLDDALRLAREGNRDVRATREHLRQAQSDVDRSLAPLLPPLSAQGKYTVNNKQITLDLAPGALSTLNSKLQADTITDLYQQTGKGGPNGTVLADIDALNNYCRDNPKATECDTTPVVIQKRN